ncbi:MAG: RNA polymerase sigma factor [Solirubrobacteraceae bacterium]
MDELPPDQRAALSLLLRQHKSYAEVATLLGIAEQAVHDRAQAALAVLAPAQARGLDPEQRREIGDYLLGQQQAVGERLRTRTLLSSSPAANAWAQALAAELGPLADAGLPEIPAPAAAPAGPAPEHPYPLSEAAAAGSSWTAPGASSSRRGGALLLGAILLALVVAAIVVFSGGGSSGTKTISSTSTSTAARSTPKEEGRIVLHPTSPHSRSVGTVEILSEGGKRAFYIQAEHIPASRGFFYAIWLYNSHSDALPLSKSPPVGSSHKLAGAALLPSNAAHFREILLTKETSTRPLHPGHVVLRGDLNLTS